MQSVHLILSPDCRLNLDVLFQLSTLQCLLKLTELFIHLFGTLNTVTRIDLSCTDSYPQTDAICKALCFEDADADILQQLNKGCLNQLVV